MNFETLNKVTRNVLKEDVKLDTMEFRPLKDFIGQTINVEGFFFSEGKYGTQVAVVGNGCKINMPGRAVEEFLSIVNNGGAEDVLNGHLALTNIKTVDTKNGTTTAYKFTNR